MTNETRISSCIYTIVCLPIISRVFIHLIEVDVTFYRSYRHTECFTIA